MESKKNLKVEEFEDTDHRKDSTNDSKGGTPNFSPVRLTRLSQTRRVLSSQLDESRTRRWNLDEGYELTKQQIRLDDVSREKTELEPHYHTSSVRTYGYPSTDGSKPWIQDRSLSFDGYNLQKGTISVPVPKDLTRTNTGSLPGVERKPSLSLSKSIDRKTLAALSSLGKKHSLIPLAPPTRHLSSHHTPKLVCSPDTSDANVSSQHSNSEPNYLLLLSHLMGEGSILPQPQERTKSSEILETTVMAGSTTSSVSSLGNTQTGRGKKTLIRILFFLVIGSTCIMGGLYIISSSTKVKESLRVQAFGLEYDLPLRQISEKAILFWEARWKKQKPQVDLPLRQISEKASLFWEAQWKKQKPQVLDMLRRLQLSSKSHILPVVSKCGKIISNELIICASLWHQWLRLVSMKCEELVIKKPKYAISDQWKRLLSINGIDEINHTFVIDTITATTDVVSRSLDSIDPVLDSPDTSSQISPSSKQIENYTELVFHNSSLQNEDHSSNDNRSIAQIHPAVYGRITSPWKQSLVKLDTFSLPSNETLSTFEVKSLQKLSLRKDIRLDQLRLPLPIWGSTKQRGSLPISKIRIQNRLRRGNLSVGRCLISAMRPGDYNLASRYRSLCTPQSGQLYARIQLESTELMDTHKKDTFVTPGQEDPFLQIPLIEVASDFVRTIRERRIQRKQQRVTKRKGKNKRNRPRKDNIVIGLTIMNG